MPMGWRAAVSHDAIWPPVLTYKHVEGLQPRIAMLTRHLRRSSGFRMGGLRPDVRLYIGENGMGFG